MSETDPKPTLPAPGATSESSLGDEIHERRGVQNPRIVDLVTTDPERGEVVLVILEPRRWSGTHRQLMEHEDKLNAYFGYVLDGHLAKQYPDYADMPVRIELRCAEEPGESERPFLSAVTRFCAENSLRFAIRVVPDPMAERAPWEAAEEEVGKDG